MSPVTTTIIEEELLDREEFERAWHGAADHAKKEISKINQAQLTVTRNSSSDCQDRQVYLYVDGELWGKVKYGRPVTREIPPGRHKVRAFNTMFSHTVEIDAVPGEHVKLRCTNGLAKAGLLTFIFFHFTALTVRLERE
jgi:hypothetical protein